MDLEYGRRKRYHNDMKLELSPRQEAWVHAEIAAERFRDEADARAYLAAVIDDATCLLADTGYSVETLRRLWDEAEASGEALDGPGEMAAIWERVRNQRSV